MVALIPEPKQVDLAEREARYYANDYGGHWESYLTDSWLGLYRAMERAAGDRDIGAFAWGHMRGAIKHGRRTDNGWRRVRKMVSLPWDYDETRLRDDNDMARRRMEDGEEAESVLASLPPKCRAVARVLAVSSSVREAARLMGVSEEYVYKWRRRMRERVA